MAYNSKAQSYLEARAREREDDRRSSTTERAETTRAPAILDSKEDSTGEYSGITESQRQSREKAQGYEGYKTSQQSIEDFQKAFSPIAKTAKVAEKLSPFSTLLGVDPATVMQFNPALGFVGVLDTGLSTLGALAGSIEEGHIGDMFDSRSREAERDALEDSGLSVSMTKEMARRDALSEYNNWGPSAYGITSQMEAMSMAPGTTPSSVAGELSRASGDSGKGIGDMAGYGGTPQESAKTEMARASGDSGVGYGGSLGDAAGGGGVGEGSDRSGEGGIGGVSGADMGKGGEDW